VKTLQLRIQKAMRDTGVNQIVLERDYAQSYVLLGIASRPELRESLVFKGGTALRKVHLPGYRFSEDLDFSAEGAPKGEALANAVRLAVEAGQAAAREVAPLSMVVQRVKERGPHPGGQEAFAVRIQFPWQRDPAVPVKIEITHDEPILLDAPRSPVLHGYEENLDVSVRTYALEEIAAEKLRATRQSHARLSERGWTRPRARDFYDLWHLVRLDAGRMDWKRVAEILPRKCEIRGVQFQRLADAFEPALLEEVRAAWERTLGSFVSPLPDVEVVLKETRVRLGLLLQRTGAFSGGSAMGSSPRLPTDAGFELNVANEIPGRIGWAHKVKDSRDLKFCSASARKEDLSDGLVRLTCPLATCAATWTGLPEEEREAWELAATNMREREARRKRR
jgi:predicted nucleotidyltransferase component of viral defense system